MTRSGASGGRRALALDLGTKRIGVAVCDDARTVATPLETIERVGDRTVEHDRVRELIDDYRATVVVVGLPLSLDGTIGPAGKTILREVKSLRKRLGVDVVTHDERLTTVTAEGSLRAQGIGSRKGRSVVDQLAASIILQSWLDAERTAATRTEVNPAE